MCDCRQPKIAPRRRVVYIDSEKADNRGAFVTETRPPTSRAGSVIYDAYVTYEPYEKTGYVYTFDFPVSDADVEARTPAAGFCMHECASW